MLFRKVKVRVGDVVKIANHTETGWEEATGVVEYCRKHAVQLDNGTHYRCNYSKGDLRVYAVINLTTGEEEGWEDAKKSGLIEARS
jgi:hypothetical protein